MKIEILTPRLILRTPSLEDADIVQRAKLDLWHELQMWMSWAHDDQKSIEAIHAFIRFSLGKSPVYCLLGFRRDNGAFAVSTGLAPNAENPESYVTGYWVPREQQGQGFAKEATNALIRYAFEGLKAKVLTVDYYEDNKKSASVIYKLGFSFVKTTQKGHKRCLDGTPLDVHHFQRTDSGGLPELQISWKNIV